MTTLKYTDILSKNRAYADNVSGTPYRIAVLSNIVINPLGEILKYFLHERHINAEVIFGDYDNITQDSDRFRNVDAVVIFWELANLIDNLHTRADGMQQEDLAKLAQRVESEIELTLRNLRDVPLVLFNTFSALLFVQYDLRDGALQSLCDRLNEALNRVPRPNTLFVDLDKILAQSGLSAAADFRQFQSSKALYTINFLKKYVEQVAPAFFSICGKMHKVLVIDCDNTLWGGIVGEDGDLQLKMNSSTRSGRVFREVQEILKGFHRQGIILALCSKNNIEDVDKVLSEHPDMLLRNADFAAKKVNWQNKADNIRQLSADLKLGLDSFVFVDDSSFEIGLVQDELPQVTCVQVPANLSDYPSVVRGLARYFFRLSHTSEDLRKTEMYKQEQTRTDSRVEFPSIEDFLRSLGLVVRIAWNEAVPIARAAQLTQKTNQFNLRTRRYTETDVARLVSDARFSVVTFSVSDRYGDYGTTGLAIVQLDMKNRVGTIETMLMSCRVIGRNIETAFVDYLVMKSKDLGMLELRAEYVKTSKNEQVSRFYDSLGFKLEEENTDVRKYSLMLADFKNNEIDYIEVRDDAA